jgi:actin-related protein
MKKFSILVAAIAVSSCHAFVIGSTPKTAVASSTTAMNMGLINDLKTLFSEEGRANRAAYAEQQRKEMEEAQREILERRTDPEAMGKYEEEIIKRRSKFMEDKSALKLQTEVEVQEESS